jgi:hypothetical protein
MASWPEDRCGWKPRCRHNDVSCLVPHPSDPLLLLPLCEEHFGKWHEAQGEAREKLVLKLFGKPVRKPKKQGGLFDGTQDAAAAD